MVKVQNKPILELIIESFKRQGFITISVNYLADVIKTILKMKELVSTFLC